MKKTNKQKRERRKVHIRKKLSGTPDKPRVYVFKSNKYINVGVVEDESGKVLFGLRVEKGKGNMKKLAKDLAAKLKKAKISVAVFDRSGYKYHGVIAEFVEELRKNDIKI
jgi:large subunit ribosomal protein L18